MIDGIFVEQSTDEHVLLRRELLEGVNVLPAPHLDHIDTEATRFSDIIIASLLQKLSKHGLVMFQLDKPLSNDQFIDLGAILGTAIPEMDPAVQPYVERDIILNLISKQGHTSNVSLQPFATNFLTLHSESSGRRIEEQPHYIILMCCNPGNDATSAQTVLVSMSAVEQRLNTSEIAVLGQTRYRKNYNGPMIVRSNDDRTIFSFRDFLSQALEWTYIGDDTHVDDINVAIRSLLAAMYASEAATGVHWKRGMIVIIDNTFFFHGRTAGSVAASLQFRHLKRLRII